MSRSSVGVERLLLGLSGRGGASAVLHRSATGRRTCSLLGTADRGRGGGSGSRRVVAGASAEQAEPAALLGLLPELRLRRRVGHVARGGSGGEVETLVLLVHGRIDDADARAGFVG